MKIGYPCINRSIGCTANCTFRLASYSETRLVETVEKNLHCLQRTLEYNAAHNLLFFRIGSGIVPFASHPVCAFSWQEFFKKEFTAIGIYIKKHGMRISMHPDQFTLINSPDEEIFNRSVRELDYHCDVLDVIGLDLSAKVQIHVGGAYGDKPSAMRRFIERYASLSKKIKRRLVIENDDRIYTLAECLAIHGKTGIPVLFDVFHHAVNCSGEKLTAALRAASETWLKPDGILMIDYSNQKKGERRGVHAESIDLNPFKQFLRDSRPLDLDIMLEIKDKEKSALKALAAATGEQRLR